MLMVSGGAPLGEIAWPCSEAVRSAGAAAATAPPAPPSIPQTVVNVSIEARAQRAGRVLSVYGSTVGNNLFRLGLSLAGGAATRMSCSCWPLA